MKAPARITTPKAYLAQLPDDRKATLTGLHHAIRRTVPKLKCVIIYGMLGYGPFRYQDASGRKRDTAIICLANQKNHISLYLCACTPEGYLAEINRHRLGKVSVGKSCIRFKQLADLNLDVAIELVEQAADLANKPGGFAM